MAVGLSAPADRALAAADFDEPVTESLLLQSRSGPLDAGAAAAAAADLRRLLDVPEVARTGEPVTSADGSTVLVQVELDLDEDASDARAAAALEPVLAAAATVRADHPGLRVEQVGRVSFDRASPRSTTTTSCAPS